MAKRILYAILLIVGVVIGFPYYKMFIEVFTGTGGLIERLPGQAAYMVFFWDAFEYGILIGVPIVAVIIILTARKGGRE